MSTIVDCTAVKKKLPAVYGNNNEIPGGLSLIPGTVAIFEYFTNQFFHSYLASVKSAKRKLFRTVNRFYNVQMQN